MLTLGVIYRYLLSAVVEIDKFCAYMNETLDNLTSKKFIYTPLEILTQAQHNYQKITPSIDTSTPS